MKKNIIATVVFSLAVLGCQRGYEVTRPDFDVTTQNAVCKVGDPVVFDIKGNADIISFYSGEFGHDFSYRDKDRITPATMNMSFDMKHTCSGDAQLLNPAIVPVSYSTDFNGEYTLESMGAATWTDITSRFSFPAEDFHIPTKNGSIVTSSKGVDIGDLYGESQDSIYIRFAYDVKAYDGTAKIGRTTVLLSNFRVNGHTPFADIQMYSIKDMPWGFVKTESWASASDKCSLPGAQASLTLNCEWNPSAEHLIYAIGGPIFKAEDVNSGVEPAIPIKSLQDPALTSYSYTFSKPGKYVVAFVAKNTNVYGKEELVRQLTITVLQDEGSLIDPEEGEWEFSAGPQNAATKVGWNLAEGIDVSWQDTDKVGIFAYDSDESLGTNCPYGIDSILEGGHGCTFIPADKSEYVKFRQNASVKFYSYYPYLEGQNDPATVKCAIPSIQIQQSAGSTAHLSSTAIFKAVPQTVETTLDKGEVKFSYSNVSPVLELSIKLSSSSSVNVPIKQIALKSANGVVLSSDDAVLDLTSPDNAVKLVNGSPEVKLDMASNVTLAKGATTKFYCLVAPGSHVADDLKVEVMAIDNSVATVSIPDAVSFLGGKVYRKTIEISTSDFVAADPFAIVQSSVSGKVGEPVTFDFTGMTSVIKLFSGDRGHDVAYKDMDRMERAKEMGLSFTMRGDPSGSANAFNPGYAALTYSTDFDGTMTESDVNAATWTDISSHFTLPSAIKTDTPSGTYDIAPLYPSDKDDIYVRFDYKFNAGTSEIGRTIIYVKTFDVVASYPDFPSVAAYSLTTVGWNALLPSTNTGGAKVVLPGSNIQFTAGSWKPAADGQAWVIAKLSAYKFNLGKDVAHSVKAAGEPMPASYQYTYAAAGTYSAVFEITTESIFGTTVKTVTIPVNITE